MKDYERTIDEKRFGALRCVVLRWNPENENPDTIPWDTRDRVGAGGMLRLNPLKNILFFVFFEENSNTGTGSDYAARDNFWRASRGISQTKTIAADSKLLLHTHTQPLPYEMLKRTWKPEHEEDWCS